MVKKKNIFSSMSRLSLYFGVMSPSEAIVTDFPPFEEFMVDTEVVQVPFIMC